MTHRMSCCSLKEALNTKISLHRIQERLYFLENKCFLLSIQDVVIKAESKQCALVSNQSRERLFQKRIIIMISINQSESPPLNPNHFLLFAFNPLRALRCGEKASLAKREQGVLMRAHEWTEYHISGQDVQVCNWQRPLSTHHKTQKKTALRFSLYTFEWQTETRPSASQQKRTPSVKKDV